MDSMNPLYQRWVAEYANRGLIVQKHPITHDGAILMERYIEVIVLRIPPSDAGGCLGRSNTPCIRDRGLCLRMRLSKSTGFSLLVRPFRAGFVLLRTLGGLVANLATAEASVFHHSKRKFKRGIL